MKSLSEATAEATKRANIYEEETMRVNEMAEKLEEQVCKIIDQYAVVPMTWQRQASTLGSKHG